MLWAGSKGGLEVRTSAGGATVLRGRFPYAVPTVLQGGRDRRQEVFAARAFGASIAAGGDIHLLVHHDFDRPLASRSAGSLRLQDNDDALTFEATLAPEMRDVGFVRDFLGTLEAGLVGGISPGFRVTEGGDYVKRAGDGLMRVVQSADLIEISAVTKPAYPQAQIEARSWGPVVSVPMVKPSSAWAVWERWRA
ncbi:HK97 family phage prohead protease [Tropicibacter alexandrii]|uniref:HK97 family phage prohead protease n=1 Tax=Tropicibacter alexandrii TaxID=2267683 RepID=UPI000EF5250B|nr:HK97 family phage prohead protease [Tropicibacter alexandrii]